MPNKLQIQLALAIILLTLVMCAKALAWDREGHRIIAEIAEQYLEPAAARQVRDLLAVENATTLAEVSNWADEIRSSAPRRRPGASWTYLSRPPDMTRRAFALAAQRGMVLQPQYHKADFIADPRDG